ncbi:hypothetical protein DL769_001502 [Monosporascus sp. CRB-8-3]|nr:hypothetical protein DL769_001502 [Monosporascus sp. CRB-8-3]
MTPTSSELIAIMGSARRFAGDVKLWELLRGPRHVRRRFPNERFSAKGFYHVNNAYHGHTNVRRVYMINEDIAKFDTEFLDGLRGSNSSVQVSVGMNDHEDLLLRKLQSAPTYLATGIGRSILSNRVAYFFDWRGPSITMNSACPFSLVAVPMTMQTLRSGESRVSVACGSNLLLGSESVILESKLKILSSDGCSKLWDRNMNGYARGYGVAAVILKTLSQAIADRDRIDCIIRETSLNQDGATIGTTMPSSVAQKAVILSTYENAGLDIQAEVDRPQYVETHGTGTPVSDPIEAEAIAKAFYRVKMESRPGADPLYLGSINKYSAFLEPNRGVDAQNLAHTLRHRRSVFLCRVLLTASSTEAAISQPLCTAVQIMYLISFGRRGLRIRIPDSTRRHGRGLLSQPTRPAHGELHGRQGTMLAVGTSIEDTQALCDDEDFVGCIKLRRKRLLERNRLRGMRMPLTHFRPSSKMKTNPNVQLVRASGVQVQKSAEDSKGVRFSSVYNEPVNAGTNCQLSGRDWAENIAKLVLSPEALSSALASGTEYDIAIEIAPYPALKGPASQTMREVLKREIPEREIPYMDTLAGATDTTLAWISNVAQTADKDAPHSRLGNVSPNSAPHSLERHNLLQGSELSWLDGYRVQSQIVLPAAGYASKTFEAANPLAEGKSIRLIEPTNLNIRQAVVFSGKESGVEVTKLTRIKCVSLDHTKAEFIHSADPGSNDLTHAATGDLDILFGELASSDLPERAAIPPQAIIIETEPFYRSLADLGYNFSGRFQSLSGLRRKPGFSKCLIKMAISIDRIRVNPALCGQRYSNEHSPVDAWLRPTADGYGCTGGLRSIFQSQRQRGNPGGRHDTPTSC